MGREMKWRERVKLAPEFLKLGQEDQYLDRKETIIHGSS